MHILSNKLASYANVNIKALVNAVGHRPTHKLTVNGKIVYINEKNAFGSEAILKRNALLLYIYLHFLKPDDNAHVLLDLTAAAKELQLSKRTILHNLSLLNKKNYIRYCEGLLEDTYDIHLEYYNLNGLEAKQGGRGYLVMSLANLKQLTSLKSINQTRFVLRGFLNEVPGKQNMRMENGCNINMLRQMFPSYTQLKDIFNILSDKMINTIFDIGVAESRKYVKIKLKTNSAEKQRNEQLNKTIKNITMHFKSMNAKYPDNTFNPSSKEITDIAKITYKYPVELVKQAIQRVYLQYNKDNVSNLPALTRSITKKLIPT